MHPTDIPSSAPGTAFSFEVFPPRTPEAARALQAELTELAPLRPAFCSVTYGAGGGGTRDRTLELVSGLRQSHGLKPLPHLTCVGHSESEIMELLTAYAAAGVGNILALRGDPPSGGGGRGDFAQAADLVRFIRKFNERGLHPDPRGFGIGVACFPEGHPATPNRLLEMDYLKAKTDAGADWLFTQAFFDNHHFHDFRERCALAGIRVPLLAGILPLTTAAGMKRMADLAGGMNYPARLLKSLRRAGDNAESFRRIALHHATAQCADLLHHDVDGIHLYTLNQAGPALAIHAGLGLSSGNPTN